MKGGPASRDPGGGGGGGRGDGAARGGAAARPAGRSGGSPARRGAQPTSGNNDRPRGQLHTVKGGKIPSTGMQTTSFNSPCKSNTAKTPLGEMPLSFSPLTLNDRIKTLNPKGETSDPADVAELPVAEQQKSQDKKLDLGMDASSHAPTPPRWGRGARGGGSQPQ